MKTRKRYGTGGQAGFDWSGLAGAVPGIADGIMSLLGGTKPSDYSNQPIMNASTIKGMSNPYSQFGYGGNVEDMDEEQLAQLQQEADDAGLTLEEYMEQLNSQQQNEEEQPDEQEPDGDGDDTDGSGSDDSADSGSNNLFSNQEFAMGGMAGNIPINVEGNEVVETPDGSVAKVKGKKHEQGGVDLNVPKGTKIFSDRLSIDGKTMQERKIKREKTLKKLGDLMKDNPIDKLLKNTVSRTNETLEAEDQQDMQLQKVANKLYAPPQENDIQGNSHAYGGVASYAYGGEEDNAYPWLYRGQPLHGQSPMRAGQMPIIETEGTGIDTSYTPIQVNTPISGATGVTVNPAPAPAASRFSQIASALGTKLKQNAGDYVGVAGNAINAIAPIINTRNMARNTKPNINRYLGFGKNALDTNQAAIDAASVGKTNELIDTETDANSSYARNVDGASSINTLRALNTATDMGKAKAKRAINTGFSGAMINLLGQRGQLYNQKDNAEMRGQTMADTETKADSDNFYSNMAQNLVNFGTNVQGIGRSLNQSKSNRVNAKMISQLSKYGLDIDEDGNLVNS